MAGADRGIVGGETHAWLARLLAAQAGPTLEPSLLRDGDIVLHKSSSRQSEALAAATRSPYTHMGLVFWRDDRPQVLEAVQPVRWTPLERWVARGREGHVVVLRPKQTVDVAAVRRAADRYLGRDYDLLFAWSDDRIYCSELVTKAYRTATGLELGDLVPLSTFDLEAAPVRALVQERVGHALDTTEPVVAPASFLDDDDLRWVFSNDPAHAGRLP